VPGGTNPYSVKDLETFTITTYETDDSVDYIVDQATSAGEFTPSFPEAGTLTAGTVASSSDVTYEPGVEIEVPFTPSHGIPDGGYIKLIIPVDEILLTGGILDDFITTKAYISVDDGASWTPLGSVDITEASGEILITDPIDGGFTADGTKITIKLMEMRNPLSTSETSSIEVYTMDTNSYAIDSVTSGLTLTVSTINEITSFAVSSDSTVNGAEATYTFEVTTNTPLSDGDKFTATFPSEISPPSSSVSCSGVTNVDSAACVVSAQVLTATLTFSGGSVDNSETFAFSLSGVTNPGSTEPSSAFTAVYELDEYDAQISQYTATDVTF
jgi:hypothetical protein